MQAPVKFNKVPEKDPEKVWEALVQSQVRFNRVPEKVPENIPGSVGAKPSQVRFRRRPGRLWCRAGQGFGKSSGEGREAFVQSPVSFNRVPEKVPGGFGAAPSHVQQGSGEGSREGCAEGLGGFGAEPGQVQQGSGEIC